MGMLDDIMADDAQAFADADLLPGGESVTYTPVGGSPVTFSANVNRDVLVPSDAGDGMVAAVEVFIRRHVTLGRTSINTGGDTITLAQRYGGTARAFMVSEIVTQDAGGWLVRVQ